MNKTGISTHELYQKHFAMNEN